MTLAKRVIPCLDVIAGRVVKGVAFVDLRDAGDPAELAARYDLDQAGAPKSGGGGARVAKLFHRCACFTLKGLKMPLLVVACFLHRSTGGDPRERLKDKRTDRSTAAGIQGSNIAKCTS